MAAWSRPSGPVNGLDLGAPLGNALLFRCYACVNPVPKPCSADLASHFLVGVIWWTTVSPIGNHQRSTVAGLFLEQHSEKHAGSLFSEQAAFSRCLGGLVSSFSRMSDLAVC